MSEPPEHIRWPVLNQKLACIAEDDDGAVCDCDEYKDAKRNPGRCRQCGHRRSAHQQRSKSHEPQASTSGLSIDEKAATTSLSIFRGLGIQLPDTKGKGKVPAVTGSLGAQLLASAQHESNRGLKSDPDRKLTIKIKAKPRVSSSCHFDWSPRV